MNIKDLDEVEAYLVKRAEDDGVNHIIDWLCKRFAELRVREEAKLC